MVPAGKEPAGKTKGRTTVFVVRPLPVAGSVLLEGVLDLFAGLLQIAFGLVGLASVRRLSSPVAATAASLPLPPAFSAAFSILSPNPMVFPPLVGSRSHAATSIPAWFLCVEPCVS